MWSLKHNRHSLPEISCGENILVSPRYSTSTNGDPSWSTTLNGHDSISFLTVTSSNRRPINRWSIVSTMFIYNIYSNTDFDIENGVSWVHGSLVLGWLSNKTLLVCERDVWWSGERSLLVGNYVTLVPFMLIDLFYAIRLRGMQRTDLNIGSFIVGNCLMIGN